MNLDYVAGFMDGEGHICINKGTNNPLVSIPQTNEGVLQIVKELVGKGNVYKVKKRESKHKQMFQWVVSGLDAIEFLEQIVDKLVIKKEEAETLIGGKHLFQRHRKKLLEEVKQGRNELRLQLMELRKQ